MGMNPQAAPRLNGPGPGVIATNPYEYRQSYGNKANIAGVRAGSAVNQYISNEAAFFANLGRGISNIYSGLSEQQRIDAIRRRNAGLPASQQTPVGVGQQLMTPASGETYRRLTGQENAVPNPYTSGQGNPLVGQNPQAVPRVNAPALDYRVRSGLANMVAAGDVPSNVTSSAAEWVNAQQEKNGKPAIYNPDGSIKPEALAESPSGAGGTASSGLDWTVIEGEPTAEGIRQYALISPYIHGNAWQTYVSTEYDDNGNVTAYVRKTVPTYGWRGRGGGGGPAHGRSGRGHGGGGGGGGASFSSNPAIPYQFGLLSWGTG